MTRRNRIPLAAALALAACASSRPSPPPSGLPRESIPGTFAPLRWSVRADDVPALFPNNEARERRTDDRARPVAWTVADVRRVDGIPGALVAEFGPEGALARARLSFADPRRDCDPDLSDRPRGCVDPGPLSRVYEALQAELARGRGAPRSAPGPHGARTASWHGTELTLTLLLGPDAHGAWGLEATVAPAEAAAR